MSLRFEPGELVWARMDGYPYWPGKIAQKCITEELKTVKGEEGFGILFFGKELTYGLVAKDSLVEFEENCDKYSSVDIDESIKADFDAAVDFAKSGVKIEDPPLELDGDLSSQSKKHKKNEKSGKTEKDSSNKKNRDSKHEKVNDEEALEEASLDSEEIEKGSKTMTESTETKIESSGLKTNLEVSNSVAIEAKSLDNEVSMSMIDSESKQDGLEAQNSATADLNVAE